MTLEVAPEAVMRSVALHWLAAGTAPGAPPTTERLARLADSTSPFVEWASSLCAAAGGESSQLPPTRHGPGGRVVEQARSDRNVRGRLRPKPGTAS